MKILHIINKLGPGGAEKLIEESLPIMNKAEGIKADVLLLTDENNVFDKKLKEEGIKIDVVPLRKPRNPINIYYIRKYIIKGQYDVIHAHLFPTIYWTSIASKLIFKGKPKLIMTEHSTHNRRREKAYLRLLEKFIYFSYDKIISISSKTQENLISWLKPKLSDLDKFLVIENGINTNRFSEARPYQKHEINSEFTENTKILCMVGRFSKQKDQATVIKSIKNLSEDVHLLLIGEGPLKNKSQDLAKEIGVEDRVHFLGFRDDVERIFKTSDIIILSSHWEGFGLAAAEGMAAGRPVIASDVDGLREVVQGAGIFFTKGNSEELFKIINSLIKNNYEYKKIAKLCLERADRFSIKKMVNKYMEVYKA